MSFVEKLKPLFLEKVKISSWLYDLLMIISGSLFITLCSKIVIPLPFTPVPVSFQTFSILLVGILFGSKKGALTVLFYLMKGIAGIPVFAYPFAGISYLLGPTGGYLFGFIVAAFVVGFLVEKGWDDKIALYIISLVIGNIFIYAFGMLWLSNFVGFNSALLSAGLFPFIMGEILKISLAIIFIVPIKKLKNKLN